MPHDAYRALYLHVPFCKKRCLYCDFTTQAVDLDNPCVSEYVDRMIMDIRRAGREGELGAIQTVYVGGGTPTYLGQRYLTEILYTLSLSMHLTPEVECSLEANPDSLTEPMVRDVWALGVNRLSIGVQSFDDGVLKTLGRIHDAQKARDAVRIAQTRFENVSVDLMCGIPGQTAQMFRESVQQAIDLGVTHVSVYPLAIEEGTPFDIMIERGDIPDVDDDAEATFMQIASDMLAAAGFSRYEVASYAKPGFACKHNIAYWTGKPYLGLGPSATTMTQNDERRMRVQDGQVRDDLNRTQMAAEDVMLGMRMTEGVADALVKTAGHLLPQLPQTLETLVAKGLVEHADGRWKPTERGWLCGNELYGALYDLAPDD